MYVLSLEFILLSFFCCSICKIKILSGKQSSLFSTQPMANSSLVRHWDFIVQDSYLFLGIDCNILSVSATMLSNPDIFWILGPNYFIMSLQSITLWDSLRVAAYSIFLWSENTFVSYTKMIPRNCSRHCTIARSSFSIVVYLRFGLINILDKKAIGLFFWLITAPKCLWDASVWSVSGIFQSGSLNYISTETIRSGYLKELSRESFQNIFYL